MTNEPTRFRVGKRSLMVCAVAVGVAALSYAWYGYRFPSWDERVLLPDGRTIVVRERRDFIEGRGTRRTWLTFSLPEMGGEQTWSEWLYPTMIGVADGKVYVVGRPRGSTQFRRYSHPRYAYVAFRWRDGKFERVPFLSVPEHLRTRENVRWCMPGGDDSKLVVRQASQWCVEKMGPDDKFPMPQIVDLDLRAREAIDWAKSGGHMPDSE